MATTINIEEFDLHGRYWTRIGIHSEDYVLVTNYSPDEVAEMGIWPLLQQTLAEFIEDGGWL